MANRNWEVTDHNPADEGLSEDELAKIYLTEDLHQIPEYGDKMTLEEFVDNCGTGALSDYDGWGKYATDTEESDINVYPSDASDGDIDWRWTHVIWYNK